MKSNAVQNSEEKRRFKGHATPIHQSFNERGKNCLLSILFGRKISCPKMCFDRLKGYLSAMQ